MSTLALFFNRELIRAKQFWRALSPEFEVNHEGFIIMGGDCNKTLSKLIYNTENDLVILEDKVPLNENSIDK